MPKPTTRQVVLAGVAVVAAATLATSADSLYDLGSRCDMGQWFSAALPIALDDGGGIASLAWLTENGPARKWGRTTAILALVGSLVGNGIDHAMIAGLIPKTLGLVLIVSAVIPAMLYASIHIAALMLRPDHGAGDATSDAGDTSDPAKQAPVDEPANAGDEPAETPATVIEHVSALVTPPAKVLTLAKPPETDLEKARRLLREGVGSPTLETELRITEYAAKQLKKKTPGEVDADLIAVLQARFEERRQA